ncbi:hypothetical protein [Galbibacter marinus]|uniref:hypothetical protein n=1 Tax=Galbibacter marinus TaxID=555500 RepID=UPI0012EADD20|nr:hypothetical protein [Galbibacter marinus]
MEYDKNGNIQRLKRKGHTNVGATTFGLMDDLDYAYDNNNRLLSVTDAVITPALMKGEFKDGNKVGNDYYYDPNGNLTSDANKGITSILYNHMNMPTKVTCADFHRRKWEQWYNFLYLRCHRDQVAQDRHGHRGKFYDNN